MVVFDFNIENRFKWVKEQCNTIPNGSKVLDVGAGGGPFKRYLEHCEYVSQDAMPLNANQLQEGGYSQIQIVSDIIEIPVENSSFDVIVCTEVLEHVPEPIKALEEFSRILKPGGTLILTAPLGSGLHQEPYHYYGGYTKFFYRKFLTEFGFDSIEILPNQGSVSHLSQQLTTYTRKFLKSPLFLTLGLILVIPMLLLNLIGRHYDERFEDFNFTVGYFVKAIKV